MFDLGGRLDINCCLTIIKIKVSLITYNLPIIIEKSDFITFYFNKSQVDANTGQAIWNLNYSDQPQGRIW